jgi:hypothetical protein
MIEIYTQTLQNKTLLQLDLYSDVPKILILSFPFSYFWQRAQNAKLEREFPHVFAIFSHFLISNSIKVDKNEQKINDYLLNLNHFYIWKWATQRIFLAIVNYFFT